MVKTITTNDITLAKLNDVMQTSDELLSSRGSNASLSERFTGIDDKIGNLIKRDIKTFGAKGDGIANDTQAFIDAFAWANSFMYTGSSSNIKYAKAEITISDGVYNLSSLSTAIEIKCNVRCEATEVLIPLSYASIVFDVGVKTEGDVLVGANISLPKITKPVGTGRSDMAGNSIAVRLNHLNSCKIFINDINIFETGLLLTGKSQGVTYCEIHLSRFNTCKIPLSFIPGVAGWVNSNQFYGGSISQSPSYTGGARISGWKHIYMDGRSPATAVVGNTFFGLSLEGNASEYLVEAYNAYRNTWYGIYHETGAPSNSVTLSSDTFTQTGHGLVVGDMVVFQATTTPTGMYLTVPYYVVEVTTSTFKVSSNKGGTPVAFTTNGSGVTYKLAARCLFNGINGLVYGNRFERTFTPPSILIDFIETNGAYDNGRNDDFVSNTKYIPEDVPLYRARNTSGTATSRPAFAAYPSSIDPVTQPKLWSTAIGDRGILFATSGAETGRLYGNSAGVVTYQKQGEIAYEVASCRRSPALINISALSLTANATTYIDVTLTDANVNDHVLVTPLGLLPSGVAYSHSYVVSANTLRIVFYNFTAGVISLTTSVQAIVFRRYY